MREPWRGMADIDQAFLLGAGLGTRLRPLTEGLPKPLVPVMNRPLLTYAMDHLRDDLGIRDLMINTHHCPEAYAEVFPEGIYRDVSLSFRQEPVLLDTAGGMDNIRDWLPEKAPFLVYNGDILTNLPLEPAVRHHLAKGNLVTLVLRSSGDELRVGFDIDSGAVVDLRGALRPEWKERFQFTGIYVVSPEFLRYIRPGKIESVVLSFLAAIEAGERIGGFLSDEGDWSDLGERESYLSAIPQLLSRDEKENRIAETAEIHPSAYVDTLSSVGEGAVIEEGAKVTESVIWAGARVARGSQLHRVVLRFGREVEGELTSLDL